MLGKKLPSSFYRRHTLEVAHDLLGKILVVRSGRKKMTARIVEVEAYRGTGEDPAAHSARGLTKRNAPMFEAGGISYVYFIYGMYVMLNFVTEDRGRPGAVLIRGVELIEPQGKKRIAKPLTWTNGPGKLTKFMGITMKDNALSLKGPRLSVHHSLLRVIEPVRVSPRVGIRDGRELYWRFFLEGSHSVSRVRENQWSKPK